MYLQLAEDKTLSRRRLFNRNKPDNPRNPVASVALAPGRALFLAMINMNIDGLATKLAKQNFKAEIEPRWLKAGGNPRKLSDAINKGKGKKPKKINFLSKFKGGKLAEDVYLSEDLNDTQKQKIVALSTAAGTAIGTAVPGIGNVAGAGAGASLGALIISIYPMIRKAADDPAGEDENKVPEPTPTVPTGADIEDPNAAPGGTGGGGTFFQKYKTPLLIGGALVGLGAIYYLTKKRK
jgi:hypothetical protein